MYERCVLNKSARGPPPFLPMPPNKGPAAPWDVGNNYDRCVVRVRVRCHHRRPVAACRRAHGHISHGMQRVSNLLEEASEGRSQHRAYDQIVFAIPISVSSNSLPESLPCPPALRIPGRGRWVVVGRRGRVGRRRGLLSFRPSLPSRSGGAGTDSNEMFRNEAIDHAVDTLTP